jgi:hypothetical protein
MLNGFRTLQEMENLKSQNGIFIQMDREVNRNDYKI